MKKENFALDVSGLSTYTDQVTGLAKEIILGATTLKNGLVSVQYGAKGNAVALNVLKKTMYGTTSACGTFTDTGSTTLAQTTVTMFPIKFSNEICLDTLQKYYYSHYMEKQYNTESLGEFEDVFVSQTVDATALEVDKILWRGSNTAPAYASVGGNLLLADGFLEKAYIASASTVNVTKTAVTASNGVTIINTLLASISSNAPVLIEEANLYCSPADFQAFLSAAVEQYKYNANLMSSDKVTEFMWPGSIGLKICRTNGLQGVASGTFLITRKDNIWAVVSDESDLDFKMWYSNDADALRMMAKLRIGTGFYQPELVVRVA